MAPHLKIRHADQHLLIPIVSDEAHLRIEEADKEAQRIREWASRQSGKQRINWEEHAFQTAMRPRLQCLSVDNRVVRDRPYGGIVAFRGRGLKLFEGTLCQAASGLVYDQPTGVTPDPSIPWMGPITLEEGCEGYVCRNVDACETPPGTVLSRATWAHDWLLEYELQSLSGMNNDAFTDAVWDVTADNWNLVERLSLQLR